MNRRLARHVCIATVAGLAASAAAQCPPSAPTGVQATDGLWCGSIVVSWNEVSGANNYSIYRNTTNSWATSSFVGASFFGDPQFTDVTVAVGQTYYYWVTAKRNLCPPGSGTSSQSSVATGYRGQDPAAPTNVEATDGTRCGGINVTWSQESLLGGSPTSFTIYRNTTNLYLTSSAVGAVGGGARAYFDDDAEIGSTYYYWVRAENDCGNTASSGDSGFVNPLAPPANESCATAAVVQSGQTYLGSTLCASIDGPTLCGWVARPDVWYRYNATAVGTLHVDTCGTIGSMNTLIGIYEACENLANNLIACNDDGCANYLSSLTIPVVAGNDYYIRVSGASVSPGPPSEGNFQLNVQFTAGSTCYPNCDASTSAPVLNVNDFTCFLNRYAAGHSYANCDASTNIPVLNVNDFTCFLNRYAAGCS